MRGHVAGYDAAPARAMARAGGGAGEITPEETAAWGASRNADQAPRRLLVVYTAETAKKSHRARPAAGGLQLWRDAA